MRFCRIPLREDASYSLRAPLSQNGSLLAHLQAQKLRLPERLGVYYSGVMSVTPCEPFTKGCICESAPRHDKVSLSGTSTVIDSRPPICSRCASAFGGKPGFAAGLRHLAHPQDIALPLGNRDHSARVEQVEQGGCFDALVIGR